MRDKSYSNLLALILFIVSTIEFFMFLINIKIPSMLAVTLLILIFGISVFGVLQSKDYRVLLYPVMAVYFLIVIPAVGDLVSNNNIYRGVVIASFIITMLVLYKKLVPSRKRLFIK